MSLRRALAAGVNRGGIEVRQILRSGRDWSSHLSLPVVFLVFAAFKKSSIPHTSIPFSGLLVAGGIAALISLTGLTTLAQILATEREDGTLLRLRGTPGGMVGYLIAKICVVAAVAVGGIVIMLFGGALLLGSPLPHSLGQWATLLWVSALGLTALTCFGAAIGAVLPNPREALALVMLPIYVLVTISGVLFPVSVMPSALQDVAQIFPVKWIAQGIRSALLPDDALAAETGHSWQHLQTFGVLGAWCVLGFLLAPRVLLRMARRESGSRLADRRQRSTASSTR